MVSGVRGSNIAQEVILFTSTQVCSSESDILSPFPHSLEDSENEDEET